MTYEMCLPDGNFAISFEHVSKRYRLGGSSKQLFLDAFGLSRFGRGKRQYEEFPALDDVSFTVPRGQRLALVGRNGAGKTTLLKLIAGNYKPTSGIVRVAGSVQALMTLGQGFHPDYTGRENINASLHYNGLSKAELKDAFEDVVDFCELGPFLDQPFKTFSSGMQSRLMFATATAIKPEILIIDEVLGAGDAYFLAKSKRRVESIVESGCTLLLVSHSMPQVLELCEKAVWLDGGKVRAVGDAFSIVKSYEEAMYGAIPGTGNPLSSRRTALGSRIAAASPPVPVGETTAVSTAGGGAISLTGMAINRGDDRRMLLQQPQFRPHSLEVPKSPIPDAEGREFRNVAPGGLSRWASAGGVRIVGLSISGPNGPTNRLVSLQIMRISLFLEAEESGEFRCTYGFAINDLQGRCFARIYSPPDRFAAATGDGRRVEMVLNPLQIGPGTYTLGVSVLHETTVEDANHAERFDLLSRSFVFDVEFPDTLVAMSADFIHTSEWDFEPALLTPAAPDGSNAEGVLIDNRGVPS